MDNWRIAVLGDAGVGKTAFGDQFVLPNDSYDPTIEHAYGKMVKVDNRMCYIEVIDTAGQEEDTQLRDQQIQQGHGFILMYSVTSRSSFDRLDTHRQNMLRSKRGDPIFMLVGNKCDKAYAREVSEEDGAALARQFGCEFIETSAKTTLNVEILFKNIVRALRQRRVELDAVPRRNLRWDGTATRPRPQCIIL